jgi:hypothetical protein
LGVASPRGEGKGHCRLVAAHLFGLHDFGLDVFEVLVIQSKKAFEGAIGGPLFLLEQLQELCQERQERWQGVVERLV